ncbi:MAG: BamA/TamA family outer membrane protein [Myxococcales bacterium]|nr:BamA/TamA family outer membrane protein [Myxococcales bacterium]
MRRLLPVSAVLLAAALAAAQTPSGGDLQARRAGLARLFAPWAGRTVNNVDIECDIPVCSGPQRAVLIDLTGLDIGAQFAPDQLADGWSKLMRTGFFRSIEPTAAPDGDGVRLVFSGVGQVVITDLDIEYADFESRLYPRQFASEIRKRLPLRKGGSFPPLGLDGRFAPGDAALIDTWCERVSSLYAQQGFVGTRVELLPEYHGRGHKQVRVTVRVHEGRQPEMGQVLVRGNEAFPYWKVVEPLSTGERVDFWRDFFGLFGVGRYARRELKEELREVERRYREEGYYTARVRLEPQVAVRDSKVYPRVRIVEGPKLTVRFDGNRSLDDEDLTEVLTFGVNGAIDETEIEETRLAIIAAYQSIARYYVQVEPERIRGPAGKRGQGEVIFHIKEGPQVYVRRVELIGNRRLADPRIFQVMETKGVAEDGVLSAFGTSAGVLQDQRVTNDLLAVRDLYRENGMPGMRFRCADARQDVREWNTMRIVREQAADEAGPAMDPALFRGRFDVWTADPLAHTCFVVIPDEDPRLVVLRIELSEGEQTTVGRLAIDPLLAGMDDQMRDEAFELLAELGFVDELGRWQRTGLNQRKLDAVRGFLLRYFHQEGYLEARIDPVCLGSDAGVARKEDCTEAQLYGVHLDAVRFETDPGPRTLVDGVLLRGNLRTEPHILQNELLLVDGGPLGTDELFLSQANLRSLGIFDAVNVETIADASRADTRLDRREAAVLVTVEEGTYRLLDVFAGLRIDSTPLEEDLPVLYSLGLSVRDRNFLGRAFELGLRLDHDNRIDSPGEYDGDDAVWEVGPYFKDRRLFGTRLDLSLATTFKHGRTSQRDAVELAVNVKPTIGYDFFNLSYPNTWGSGLRATLVTEYRWERRRGLTGDQRPLFGDPTQSVTLEPAITWDRRDNPLHPTRGWLLTASAEVLFNRFADLGVFELAPSFKETLTAQWVESFLKKRLIIVPSLRLGAVQSDEAEDDLKSGFYFKAGGDGVTLPVRGYADASIEACQGRDDDNDPFGLCGDVLPPGIDAADNLVAPRTIGGKAMMLLGLEARFPTFILEDFWWALFTDIGAVAPGWSAMDTDRLFPSAGVGLRWLITGQIPLRLDLAYPLRETVFSKQTPRFHLNIFYTL